jgi:phage terminase small subunit
VQVKDLVNELAKVAFTNLPDLLEPTDLLQVKDLSELTEAQKASILEIKETRGKQGTTRTIKLHNKLTAIDMLMKNLGGYVTASDLIDKLPPERLEQLIDELLQKLKRQ